MTVEPSSVGKWGGVIGAIWTALGLLQAGSFFLLVDSPTYTFPEVWAVTAADAYVFALLTALVVLMVRRVPWDGGRPGHRWLLYAAAGVVYIMAHLLLYLSLARWLGLSLMATPETLWAHVGQALPRRFYINAGVYVGTVALAVAWGRTRQARERAVQTAHLEARLAVAQLALLQQQIDAHFLFNTLHSTTELVHTDPAAAEQMLLNLSRLLQVGLQADRRQEVTLEDELELLHHYLAIQQVRLGARLTVRFDVPPSLHGAFLPSLLLQTLVENALRHGIARKPGPGTISITASRQPMASGEARLCLWVRDDGHGLEAAAQAGIGFANTQARLQALYGAAHRFALRGAPDGGTEAYVALPLHFSPLLPHNE